MQDECAAKKLSLIELMGLFGRVDEDENGKFSIHDDYASSSNPSPDRDDVNLSRGRDDANFNASHFGTPAVVDNGERMGESSRQDVGLGISVDGHLIGNEDRSIGLEDYTFDDDEDDYPI